MGDGACTSLTDRHLGVPGATWATADLCAAFQSKSGVAGKHHAGIVRVGCMLAGPLVPVVHVDWRAEHSREGESTGGGWSAPHAPGLDGADAAEGALPNQDKLHTRLRPGLASVGDRGSVGHLCRGASCVGPIVDVRWWGAGDLCGEEKAW